MKSKKEEITFFTKEDLKKFNAENKILTKSFLIEKKDAAQHKKQKEGEF